MTVTKTKSYQKGSTDSAVGFSESIAMLPLGFMTAGLWDYQRTNFLC